jgi:hypothetical protein
MPLKIDPFARWIFFDPAPPRFAAGAGYPELSNARGDMFRKPEGIGTCPQSTIFKLRKGFKLGIVYGNNHECSSSAAD